MRNLNANGMLHSWMKSPSNLIRRLGPISAFLKFYPDVSDRV